MPTTTDPIDTYTASLARLRELEADLAAERTRRGAALVAAREFHGTGARPASKRLLAELAGVNQSTLREHLNVALGGKRTRGAR